MPGIVVTTSVRTGPVNVQTAATATMFVVGRTERGPDGSSHLITSLSDYEDIFGGYISAGYTHQTIETFFEEGGSRAYVSRVVDADAVEASLALSDGTATCINLLASGTGTWANSGGLTAQVEQPSASVNFRVKIRLNGELVYTTSTHTSADDAVEEINNSAIAALYLTASTGAGTGIPVVLAATNFAGGTNGSAIVDADVETALETFTSNLGPGAVCAPGFTSEDVRNYLLAHAEENNRIAIMGFDKETSTSTAISEAANHSALANAQYGAFFYPWVKIPNGSLTMTIPPEGYVCGTRAKVHNTFGAWNPYAGERTEAKFVTGVYSPLSKSQADTLDEGFINAIRVINDTVRVYGARSASEDVSNYRFIIAREVLNQIVHEAETALEALLFLPIDGRQSTFSRVQATLVAIMDRIRIGGGLYEAFDANGKQIDPGFTVQVNNANNPLSQLATGVIKAKIGARVSSIGDTIEVEITKSNLTSTLV
jgi:phage tail sheath protein FI